MAKCLIQECANWFNSITRIIIYLPNYNHHADKKSNTNSRGNRHIHKDIAAAFSRRQLTPHLELHWADRLHYIPAHRHYSTKNKKFPFLITQTDKRLPAATSTSLPPSKEKTVSALYYTCCCKLIPQPRRLVITRSRI